MKYFLKLESLTYEFLTEPVTGDIDVALDMLKSIDKGLLKISAVEVIKLFKDGYIDIIKKLTKIQTLHNDIQNVFNYLLTQNDITTLFDFYTATADF